MLAIMLDPRFLARRYQSAHNEMRNVDGLQPQEAFDELLKYVFFKERDEGRKDPVAFFDGFASDEAVATAAKTIRKRFRTYASESATSPSRWKKEGFQITDLALAKVHAIFQGLRLTSAGLDLRSAALREFLSGPIRKGLGIFLTPEVVVREIVDALSPRSTDSILDPACGSGTFLVDAVRSVGQSSGTSAVKIFGVDKNPRMVQLAEFNCGHLSQSDFARANIDALLPFGSPSLPSWYKPNSFDLVITNPPFGVSLDQRAYAFDQYATCRGASGEVVRKRGSEIVFVERALELLKPGGRLGIVLPRGVITNHSLASARQALGEIAAVLGVVTLPPETFAATGTQTTTVVVFAEKYGSRLTPASPVTPFIARIENVGFDTTGRTRQGSQLPALGSRIAKALSTGKPQSLLSRTETVPAANSFSLLEKMLGESRSAQSKNGRRLAELVDHAATGLTPPRAAYAGEGLFLVKVGNLTGSGIDWIARDRNFAADGFRKKYSSRLLQRGDIVLTSSAHSPKYIGKKVDIVTRIPQEIGGSASFVGEVMLIRPSQKIDPFLLLAYLRSPDVMQSLQDRVRGQTAHLHKADVLDLIVDEELFDAPQLKSIADVLRHEAHLAEELNSVAFKQLQLRKNLEQARFAKVAAE